MATGAGAPMIWHRITVVSGMLPIRSRWSTGFGEAAVGATARPTMAGSDSTCESPMRTPLNPYTLSPNPSPRP